MKKFLALLVLTTSLSACAPTTQESTIFAMNTVMTFSVNGKNAEEASTAAIQAINELSNQLSVTVESSEISKINANPEQKNEVSEQTFFILEEALKLSEQTDGALDISIYPIMKAWGFTSGEYRVPDDTEIANLIENVDYSLISAENNTISMQNGMQIDLGSIAKGYAGDMASEILKEHGIESALLNLGGNVELVGSNAEGEDFRIGVQDPLDASKFFGILSLSDTSIVTSGGYNRYFEENDEIYWHIMDPFTGKPSNSGIISVTIVGENGLMCDGLSTALFVMGEEKAIEYWREHGGFDMLLITENNEIIISENLSESFELLEEYENIYNLEVIS